MMVRMVRMSCMGWVVMHWVEMMGWIVLARIKMGWRNRIIWMSATLLSPMTTMPVIVSHIFSSFRYRYRLCYLRINSLRKCLYARKMRPLHPTTKRTIIPSNFSMFHLIRINYTGLSFSALLNTKVVFCVIDAQLKSFSISSRFWVKINPLRIFSHFSPKPHSIYVTISV